MSPGEGPGWPHDRAAGEAGPVLMRAFARALVRLFYHRVDVVGVERVPPSGPLVIVANHRNALVDPLILIATLPRVLRPVAKAPLFRHPLLAPFLRLAGALPVHRRRDPGSDPTRNAVMFRAVAAALRQGGAILIFPEGVSQPEPVLMPLRTGVARMVLGTEGDPGTPATTLLPVGLTFHEPGTFRTGWALVLVGAPVPVDDYRLLAAQEPERAVRELTARVAEALRTLIVEIEDRETLRLTEGLEAVRRAQTEDAPGAIGRGTSRAERVAWVQVATRAYRWLAPRAPARVARFRTEVERYLADLERLGLSPDVVGRAYPPGVARRYALREGLALLGGLPLAAWGLASHALPYWLTALGTRAFATSADVTATVKLLAGAVLYPACWALEAWGAWRILGGWGLAAFLVGLFPTGLFALGWQARLLRVRRDARASSGSSGTAISSRGSRLAAARWSRRRRRWRGSCPRRCWRAPAPAAPVGERAAVSSPACPVHHWRPLATFWGPVSARRASATPPGASYRTAGEPAG